ncbi:alkylhydroperoxidase [Nocardiopsis gilva YIM 90087]|uniref:Alkylhydroperoxidase n=1 Tax=Nocardiopsis gilva YIM 90087 TaxID=1235441 RepID=A0A223S826_9ACTN|nr:carboxymuconolactone decarboxylase family protein [Nocardiopsis gilva]ASU84263.1 alkylhydroperoxidase [Nocardiopsis gilva YIM 90087]
MPRIPVHTVDNAPEAARETLRALEKKFGMVLNIHGEMAHAPIVLAAYHGINQAIADHGSFDARTREAIALTVGAANDCAYCQSAHTAAGRAAGWSLDETVDIRSGTFTADPRLGALLAVAREITADKGEVSAATWEAARQAGWGEAELAELYTHVVVNMFTNYFNHYAQTELDLPKAPGLD